MRYLSIFCSILKKIKNYGIYKITKIGFHYKALRYFDENIGHNLYLNKYIEFEKYDEDKELGIFGIADRQSGLKRILNDKSNSKFKKISLYCMIKDGYWFYKNIMPIILSSNGRIKYYGYCSNTEIDKTRLSKLIYIKHFGIKLGR